MPDRRTDYLDENADPVAPAPAYRRWSGKKKAIVVVAILVIPIALVLVYLPVESTSIDKTLLTSGGSCQSSPCTFYPAEFNVGDSRYAWLTGTWATNVSAGDIIVTVNDGLSNQPCSLCNNSLYLSGYSAGTEPASGSFDVLGYGPFHISVIPLGGYAQKTTFQLTLKSALV
jgi:hypothetical protein